ncbi:hypothetical protein [Salinibacter phage 5_9]
MTTIWADSVCISTRPRRVRRKIAVPCSLIGWGFPFAGIKRRRTWRPRCSPLRLPLWGAERYYPSHAEPDVGKLNRTLWGAERWEAATEGTLYGRTIPFGVLKGACFRNGCPTWTRRTMPFGVLKVSRAC